MSMSLRGVGKMSSASKTFLGEIGLSGLHVFVTEFCRHLGLVDLYEKGLYA